MLGSIPLSCYAPLRRGVVSLRRGSILRGACTAILKRAAEAYRPRLATLLPEVRPLDHPSLSFAPADSMVMEAVYWFGVQGYEGRVADVWTSLCQRSRSILEVGGNVGLFTVIGAKASKGHYTVVEPVPAVAQILGENLRRNDITHVDLLLAAAIPGHHRDMVHLDVPDERRTMPVGAHLTVGTEIANYPSATRIAVDGIPFRDLVEGRDLLKIDAEGVEVDLLTSAFDSLSTARPTMLVEVLPGSSQLRALLCDMARRLGYHIVVIPEWGSDRLVEVTPEDLTADCLRRHNSKDVVLTPTPLDAEVMDGARIP